MARPIPLDPSAGDVMRAISASDEILLGAPGPAESFAAETFQNDGGGYQRVIAIHLNLRRNNTPKEELTTILLAPETALSLAECIRTSANWLELQRLADLNQGGTDV